MTPKQLDEIEARVKAAQVGPWRADTSRDAGRGWPCVFTAGVDNDGISWVVQTDGVHASETNGATAKEDAAFVAAARQDVPALVKDCRAVRAALEKLLAASSDSASFGFNAERMAIAMDGAAKALRS